MTLHLFVPLLVLGALANSGLAAGEKCGGEHRRFDFWIGDWKVTRPDGTPAGTNRVERLISGCVLQEYWKGSGGSEGTSLSFFDPGDGKWHQVWVDDDGGTLFLAGSFHDGKMEMSGDGPSTSEKGKTVRNRITWEPRPDGAVRQLWEVSKDGGATWKTVFDGIYRRS